MAIAIGPAIAAELANGARDVLRQGAAVLGGNQGEYIKSGEPESIYGRLQQATARQYCRRYADDPAAYGDRTRVFAENICRPYLDDIGYGTGPTIDTPIRGGQCSEMYRFEGTVSYRVDGDFIGSPSFPSEAVATENVFPGPVSFAGADFFNPGPFGPRGFICRFQTATGIVTRIQVTNATNGLSNVSLSGNFLLANGTTGDCGSPPPVITDPIPPVTPGPRFEPFSPSPDIDIDIGVEINIDGSIDVDFGTGPITIDPFPEGDGDGGDGGGGGSLPPGDTGEPGDSGSTGAGGEAEGEAPEGSVLVGLQMNLTAAPPNPNLYAPGVYRGGAYIYMGGDAGLDQDFAGSMLYDGQFVFAEKENLTRWRVRANVSYNWLVIPFYRQVE